MVFLLSCAALLAEAGVDSSDCVEKEELVQKVVVSSRTSLVTCDRPAA